MRILLTILVISVLLCTEDSPAQGLSIIQGSDGTSGTIVDLGGGFRSYSDSHGNRGTILDLGGGFQTYQFSSPHGGLQSGTILTFPGPQSGAGAPPAGWTPAPVLPFMPRSPVMPREHAAPVTPFGSGAQGSTSGTFGGYGSGRFGR
jgi:hypothetical protein